MYGLSSKKEGRLDIILPKKRDKCNNMIGFVKVKNEEVAHSIIKALKYKKLLGSKMDLKVVQVNHQGKESGLKREIKNNRSGRRKVSPRFNHLAFEPY